MTAEVLYFVYGNGTDEGGGDFRKVHLEKGELILDEIMDKVHSPLYTPGLFLPIGSQRNKRVLSRFMEDPERKISGNEILEEMGDIFFTPTQVRKTIWYLRLKLGDIGTDIRKQNTTFSLIHSGSEGYSLTPYEYRDLNFVRLALLHVMTKIDGDPLKGEEQPMFRSHKYDFSKNIRR